MYTIFLSYRRQDSADICDRLNDHLRLKYGKDHVFRDTTAILAGSDFSQSLQSALADSRVVLVVIGPGWRDARDAQGARRLDDPNDWVRHEVASALRAGKKVIPVLVRGAQMPQSEDLPEDMRALAQYQPVVVRSGPDFLGDVGGLQRRIGRDGVAGPPHPSVLICGIVVALSLALFFYAGLSAEIPSRIPLQEAATGGWVLGSTLAIGWEFLRIVTTRQWPWLILSCLNAVSLALALLLLGKAGVFLLFLLWALLAIIPILLGLYGPPDTRPGGDTANQVVWRATSACICALSALALICSSAAFVLAFIDTSVASVSGAFGNTVVIVAAVLAASAWLLTIVRGVGTRQWPSALTWLVLGAFIVPLMFTDTLVGTVYGTISLLVFVALQSALFGSGWQHWHPWRRSRSAKVTVPVLVAAQG